MHPAAMAASTDTRRSIRLRMLRGPSVRPPDPVPTAMLEPIAPRVLAPALAVLALLPVALAQEQPAATAPAAAAEPKAPPPDVFQGVASALTWRLLGPSNMGGRITDLESPQGQPETWYVGTAASGLWRTSNAGNTWEPLFQSEGSASVGDVAVAPSNPDVIWVGTGEENARNSVTFGDGVYKSTDGGKTFTNMGLRESFQIGHIAIDPKDADTVFVAALGRLWGDNPDRGVFRTKDGGQTWQKVLHLDEKTGCIDVRVDPQEPKVVHACMYERKRDQYDSNDPAVRFGPKAGYFRSEDGGDTWTRIKDGLPSVDWGRSALTIHQKDPKIVYLQVESVRSGWANGHERMRGGEQQTGNAFMGVQSANLDEGDGAKLTVVTKDGPADKAGFKAGDIVLAIDAAAIEDSQSFSRTIREHKGGEKSKLKVKRGSDELEIEITWGSRDAGAAGDEQVDPYQGQYSGRLYGQRENVQTRQGKDGFETGGIYRSDDRGLTWKRVNSLTDRPFYFSVIAVAPQDPETIWSCGIPVFKSTDGGKRFRQVQRQIHVDFHALWIDPRDVDHVLVAGDGGLHQTHDGGRTWEQIDNLPIGQFYHVDTDTSDPYRIYGGLQDNGTWGGPSRSRWSEGTGIDEWVTIAGGDGFGAAVDQTDPNIVICTSQNGALLRVNMARGSAGGVDKPGDAGEWNWDTPFFLSPHNQKILYLAGRKAVRSLDQGRNSQTISPVLPLTEKGTATAIAESPRVAGLLYAGTDDGALWRSKDGGQNWQEIHDKVLGLRGPRFVSSIAPSRYANGRVYVTFDGHRQDDQSTYVFVSEDMGDSWRSLGDNLPHDQPCFVVLEDQHVENLLFCGTEVACYASSDRGGKWTRLGSGLPTVQVRDLVIQDREAELVAATHGHGMAVIDIRPLREIQGEVATTDVHLFTPNRVTLWNMRSRATQGEREWTAANPSGGTTIHLWTAEAPAKDARLKIVDIRGEVVANLPIEATAGLHSIRWDPRGGRRRGGSSTAAGSYAARYEAGDYEWVVPIVVRDDPDGGAHPLANPLPTRTGQ